MRAFLIAVQFLTCMPVPRRAEPSAEERGRSVLYYPAVGFGMGMLLIATAFAVGGAEPALGAALLLLVWVGVSGGLHLDGFADTADAWVGGYGDRDKTLAIMKDPRRGSAAIVAVVLLLLLKYSALMVLLRAGEWSALLFAPVIARAAIVFLFLTTSYARPGGIGASHATHLPRRAALVVLIGTLVAVALFDYGMIVPLLVAGAIAVGLRQMVRCRLGGSTGDTLGASCEIVEATVLLTAALALGHIDG